MSLDIAYSTEINEFIDPDRAYEYFWAGILKDKKSFICPGENCDAQVTCANLDEESQNMRVVPHYRIYGKHHPDCEIDRKIPLKIKGIIIETQQSKKEILNLSVVDSFSLSRPPSYYESQIINKDKKSKSVEKKKYIVDNIFYNLKQIGEISKIYSVRSIVGRYLRYHRDGTLDNRKINVSGKNISYSSFFIQIRDQEFDSLPEYSVIYYGWAYIDKYDKYYRIKFKKSFIKENDKIQVSFFVSNDLIEKYEIKKLIIKRMKKISLLPKPTAFVFIYGKPKIKITKEKDKKFINLEMKNLDFMDIDSNTPLPKKTK
ncbi:hypothetical protein [Xenorhabdus bovienii]|uniref:hypothetical protein n=1 Tax=Xenorhabdus bovienii TaxID=40576 RepID=UPI0023B2E610|nr:hypothetical protein [Xenorhabdus bovienii]MDE9485274.1 hypothetical protein [Xenorhabdus bovienii]